MRYAVIHSNIVSKEMTMIKVENEMLRIENQKLKQSLMK